MRTCSRAVGKASQPWRQTARHQDNRDLGATPSLDRNLDCCPGWRALRLQPIVISIEHHDARQLRSRSERRCSRSHDHRPPGTGGIPAVGQIDCRDPPAPKSHHQPACVGETGDDHQHALPAADLGSQCPEHPEHELEGIGGWTDLDHAGLATRCDLGAEQPERAHGVSRWTEGRWRRQPGDDRVG